MRPVDVKNMKIKILLENDSRDYVGWEVNKISESKLYLREPIKAENFPKHLKISLFLGGVVDKWQKYELNTKEHTYFSSNYLSLHVVNCS